MALPVTEPVVFYIPDGAGNYDAVQVDACVSESHALVNTLTDNPVEKGFNVTDHSRPEPRQVTLECVQTNTPLGASDNSEDRAGQLWSRFLALWQSPQLLSVQTARDLYTSMGITNVSNKVDARSANALVFTVTLKEVRVVQNRLTRVTVAKAPKAHVVYKMGGAQTSTAAADNRTKLAQLADAAGIPKP